MTLLDYGGFGCIFYPNLDCKRSKFKSKKNKNIKYIGKLQRNKDNVYEYNIMRLLLKKIKKVIPNYNNYFILDPISTCFPKQTRTQLLQKYDKCPVLQQTSYPVSQLIMPYLGINLEHVLNNDLLQFNKNFIKYNLKLIELYIKAIIPLNKIGFYHNDLKSSNIVIDDKFYFRIIDFGLMNKLRYEIFSFNTPLNGILLTPHFIDYYINNKLKYTNTHILINYLLSIELYKDTHYTQIIEPILKLMNNQIITESTANLHPLLFNYYLNCISTTTPFNNLLKQNKSIYTHNLDTIGFLSIYSYIYLVYTTNKYDKSLCILKEITKIYLKYIFILDKISYKEFINDVYKLNLCF